MRRGLNRSLRKHCMALFEWSSGEDRGKGRAFFSTPRNKGRFDIKAFEEDIKSKYGMEQVMIISILEQKNVV